MGWASRRRDWSAKRVFGSQGVGGGCVGIETLKFGGGAVDVQGNRNIEVSLLLSCYSLPAGVCLQTRDYSDFFLEGSGWLLIARHSSTHQQSTSRPSIFQFFLHISLHICGFISRPVLLPCQSESNK